LNLKAINQLLYNLKIKEVMLSLKETFVSTKLANSFKHIKFSFFLYWKPTYNVNTKQTLDDYFGCERTLNCLNRVDARVVECSSSVLNELAGNSNEANIENFVSIENLIGCLLNQIKM
jgi:hypothetical protein